MAKPKRPTWFKVFDYQYPFILAMPDAAVGKAFRAGLAYFRNRELPEGLDPMETAIFNLFRDNADEALEDFERSVENGKKGSLAKKEGKTPSAPREKQMQIQMQMQKQKRKQLLYSQSRNGSGSSLPQKRRYKATVRKKAIALIHNYFWIITPPMAGV